MHGAYCNTSLQHWSASHEYRPGTVSYTHLDNRRSTMHGLPFPLLQAQAASIGIPLHAVDLTPVSYTHLVTFDRNHLARILVHEILDPGRKNPAGQLAADGLLQSLSLIHI